jgi:hypothetical protein
MKMYIALSVNLVLDRGFHLGLHDAETRTLLEDTGEYKYIGEIDLDLEPYTDWIVGRLTESLNVVFNDQELKNVSMVEKINKNLQFLGAKIDEAHLN